MSISQLYGAMMCDDMKSQKPHWHQPE